jgi:hypothetical protein
MIVRTEQIRLSATDLGNHLACRHLTVLDLQVARGTRPAPGFSSPDLRVVQELGLRHEAAYLTSLTGRGFSVADKTNEWDDVIEKLDQPLSIRLRHPF